MRGRIAVAALISAIGFSVVAARLVDVMVFSAGPVRNVSSLPRPAQRADFVDRNGDTDSAGSSGQRFVCQSCRVLGHGGRRARLATATGADERRLIAAFKPQKGYVLIQRGLTPDQRDVVMHLGLPGLDFIDGHKRFYPAGRTVAHAVGQVDTDDNGVSGLELGLEARLRQKTDPVVLSLDMRVQYALEHEAAEAMRSFHAKAAGGIVMNVHTGKFGPSLRLPDYEPNLRKLEPGDSIRNRMTQDVYELGSIFKIFAFTEAVEEKTIRLDEPLQSVIPTASAII